MVCDFLRGAPEFFYSIKGGWWLSRTNIPNQTWPLPKSRVQRWGYAKQHPQSILNSTFL